MEVCPTAGAVDSSVSVLLELVASVATLKSVVLEELRAIKEALDELSQLEDESCEQEDSDG